MALLAGRFRQNYHGAMTSKLIPKTIDDYLAAIPADKRAALEKLRKAVKAAAPKAEECISYRLPAFRLEGKMLVAFGAAANHCAFYPMSSSTIKAFRDELKNYETSKGTIRFQPDRSLPTGLVRKLVKARIKENADSTFKPLADQRDVLPAEPETVR